MLFDLSAYCRPLPANVLVFASGANRAAEIVGFSHLGIPLGVSVQRLTQQAIDAILCAEVPVMIDSVGDPRPLAACAFLPPLPTSGFDSHYVSDGR